MLSEKAITALIAGVLSGGAGAITGYAAATQRFEGRVDAIEKSLHRIETRLFPPPPAAAPMKLTKGT